MARGGKRQGTPGRSYANRTDMNQPIKVAPGQPYGQGKALADAQRMIPLPNSAAVPVATATSGPLGATPAMQPGPLALPGQNPFLRPTERPGEPVTSGIPAGPGPGPEALTSLPNPTQADAQQWARYLPTLEFMASQPDASMSTRNFVRRLRSIIPVEAPPGT